MCVYDFLIREFNLARVYIFIISDMYQLSDCVFVQILGICVLTQSKQIQICRVEWKLVIQISIM